MPRPAKACEVLHIFVIKVYLISYLCRAIIKKFQAFPVNVAWTYLFVQKSLTCEGMFGRGSRLRTEEKFRTDVYDRCGSLSGGKAVGSNIGVSLFPRIFGRGSVGIRTTAGVLHVIRKDSDQPEQEYRNANGSIDDFLICIAALGACLNFEIYACKRVVPISIICGMTSDPLFVTCKGCWKRAKSLSLHGSYLSLIFVTGYLPL
jgi:hypothetical protein